ncbi:MAG: biopolymer transporter ExbD, partial [Arenimonas sp.]
LIIFMVTVPALSYPLQVDLARDAPPISKSVPPEPVQVAIDAAGMVYWNHELKTLAQLQALLQAEGARGITNSGVLDASRQPTIEIAADHEADYEIVAKVLSRAKNASLVKISFVEPG